LKKQAGKRPSSQRRFSETGTANNSPDEPGSYPRIRSDHATEVAEDYVEAIAEATRVKGSCRAVDLAKHFEVSHVTVNRTIGRLVRDGFVETIPYGPVELTAKGKMLARAAAERHEIVYQFLLALGVSESTARTDSEGIEHHVSSETLRKMKAHLREKPLKGKR
jgi:DtxR family manganese transport transcriptional regulator